MPSVDKIGRHFPLTIAIQIEPHPAALFTAFSAQTWYASLERLALASLDVNILPNDLDQNLANYPFPKPHLSHQSVPVQELANWWQISTQSGLSSPKTLILPTVGLLTERFEAVAENIFMTAGQGKSIWWKVSQSTDIDEGATQLHCFAGLPKEYSFAMLLGDDIDIL